MKKETKSIIKFYSPILIFIGLMFAIIFLAPYSYFLSGYFGETGYKLTEKQKILAARVEAELERDPDPDLPPVLVYNKEFAKRFGLDPAKAMELDKGLYGISMVFKKRYSLRLDTKKDPLMLEYHLDRLTRSDWNQISPVSGFYSKDKLTDFLLFPILFNHTIPFNVYYDCYLNFYFDSYDQKVKDVAFPLQQTWLLDSSMIFTDPVRNVIGMFGVDRQKKIEEPILKRAIAEHDYQEIEKYSLDTYYTDAIQFSALKASTSTPHEGGYVFKVGLLNGYRSHFKNFLPGITYLSVETQCIYFKKNSNREGAWLWLANDNYESPEKETSNDPTPGASNLYNENYKPNWFLEKSDRPLQIKYYHFTIPPEITNSNSLNKVTDTTLYLTPVPVYKN